jgi:redox-sensitive bicupin YhaK (pirin superfamily)
VSNTETRPDIVACEPTESRPAPEILQPRMVPLGGPRAASVRRTLPQRSRSLIGAWCFADHYGPNDMSANNDMNLPGHPHTGLQTVSWLFAGELEHLDTIGTRSLVRAGEMNLMTSGRGIAHSEFTTPNTKVLHGVQLWVALPEHDRFTEPRFEHYVPHPFTIADAHITVFLGSLMGSTSPVRTSTPLLGAQLDLTPGSTLNLDVDPTFEHGILLDSGDVRVDGVTATDAELLYIPTGSTSVTIAAGNRPVRAVLLGGEPLHERIIMWWNFIGRSHDEIVKFRSDWQAQAFADHSEEGPYGLFPEQWITVLPAPEMPNAHLKPRS